VPPVVLAKLLMRTRLNAKCAYAALVDGVDFTQKRLIVLAVLPKEGQNIVVGSIIQAIKQAFHIMSLSLSVKLVSVCPHYNKHMPLCQAWRTLFLSEAKKEATRIRLPKTKNSVVLFFIETELMLGDENLLQPFSEVIVVPCDIFSFFIKILRFCFFEWY
jgi:hypothetical protein